MMSKLERLPSTGDEKGEKGDASVVADTTEDGKETIECDEEENMEEENPLEDDDHVE